MAQRFALAESPLTGENLDSQSDGRVAAAGKFLSRRGEKIYVRGVTYGTFRPGADGSEYERATVESDFALMQQHGINAVRVYTVPPRWLLDSALRHGLMVMVGLPWEQHVSFLDGRARARSIEERVREGVRACANHPAVLCYAIGNEIPAAVVRWYGARRIERFLERLYWAAKHEDPEALVTYVNFPSTEYLRLPFLDLMAFNVYLEEEEALEAYLARLQNLAGDRPMLIAELGFDSHRNGTERQAEILDWQVRRSFAAGSAGTFVFAWTDEWHRGGTDVEDWDFGLTDRERRPKPALKAVARAYAETPFVLDGAWPRISVVVCSYNGSRTIGETCQRLGQLQYPRYEILVVNDGSTDDTAAIAASYGLRVISTPNHGLSHARNVGLEHARGEIVVYLDDDAYPDPHWLLYLASAFRGSEYVGIGGPNIAPGDDGWIADCVGHAPGGPIHVLISDHEAEHIPGCNMAFRRDKLLAIGGFDPRFRVAGDDVDVCWRLQEQGWKIGFHPAAMVWHHRRNSVRAYLRQQRGYGRAESLLERKWPSKYNGAGHLSWAGRLYGTGLTRALHWRRERVLYGTWGNGEFQSAFPIQPGFLVSIPMMPEWFLVTGGLGLLTALGFLWRPLLLAVPLFVLAVLISLMQATLSASNAELRQAVRARGARAKMRLLVGILHLAQPLARLRGRRVDRLPGAEPAGLELPLPYTVDVWSERWRSRDSWLSGAEAALRGSKALVVRGGEYDRWDLAVRGGLLGGARLRMANEEHGNGKQMLRYRCWPRCSRPAWIALALEGGLAVCAAVAGAPFVAAVLGGIALSLAIAVSVASGRALAALRGAIQEADMPHTGNSTRSEEASRRPMSILGRITPAGRS